VLWLVSGVVALMAGGAAAAAEEPDWRCQLRCEVNHAHRRAECAEMFDEGDPLEKDCLEAAFLAYWRCLTGCSRFWMGPAVEIAGGRPACRDRPRQPAAT
jgi:hypothetical protein